MDLISVIVIGYNIQDTVQECLDSIFNQKYRNLEIIFVDDGSIDRTGEIVKGLAQKDNRLCYFFQKNHGANHARKKGYQLSGGSYVMFIDGDDFIEKYAIEKAYEVISKNKVDFVCFDYREFDQNGIIEKEHPYMPGKFHDDQFLLTILERKQAHYLWNKLYDTNFLNKMDFMHIPSITMGDDLAANVRMGICNPSVIAIDDKLYNYRSSDKGVSRKVNEKYIELNFMMIDIENQLGNAEHSYRDLIDYNYFLNFFFYVVRNKYPYSWIQKSIYNAWKKRNVSIKRNIFIKKEISKRSVLEKILIYSIDYTDLVEYIIMKLYSLIHKEC